MWSDFMWNKNKLMVKTNTTNYTNKSIMSYGYISNDNIFTERKLEFQ